MRHRWAAAEARALPLDRKSTRLNSSHQIISYAVFCLKKKKKTEDTAQRIGGEEAQPGAVVERNGLRECVIRELYLLVGAHRDVVRGHHLPSTATLSR